MTGVVRFVQSIRAASADDTGHHHKGVPTVVNVPKKRTPPDGVWGPLHRLPAVRHRRPGSASCHRELLIFAAHAARGQLAAGRSVATGNNDWTPVGTFRGAPLRVYLPAVAGTLVVLHCRPPLTTALSKGRSKTLYILLKGLLETCVDVAAFSCLSVIAVGANKALRHNLRTVTAKTQP